MARTAVILLLVCLGFLITYGTTRDPLALAIGCWVLAGVYAWSTGVRRIR
jgi:hypothetical protein